MILRTPPPRKRRADSRPPESPPGSDHRLVIYEDPPVEFPESSHDHSDQMLCTYQCRQLVKSEFLDNYGSMEKAVGDYQLKVQTLNHNLVKAEMEGKKYRDQFLYAEQELAAARGREQALQEKVLKEINDSQERLKRQIQQCHELEVKLRKEESARKNVESSAASAEEKVHLLESKFKHLSGTTEREKNSLENEVKHLREDSKLSISRCWAELERVECRARNAEKESELLKEKLLEATDQLKKCLLEKAELEKKLTSFTYPKDTTSQSDILVKHLQEELRNYVSGFFCKSSYVRVLLVQSIIVALVDSALDFRKWEFRIKKVIGRATLADEDRKLTICKSVVCFEKIQRWELARSVTGSFSFLGVLIRMLVVSYIVICLLDVLTRMQ